MFELILSIQIHTTKQPNPDLCFPGQGCDVTLAQNDTTIPLPICPPDFVGPLIGCGGRSKIV